jgi:hypothetical protein
MTPAGEPDPQRFAEVVRAEPVDLGWPACSSEARSRAAASTSSSRWPTSTRWPPSPGRWCRGRRPAAAAEGLRLALGERAGFGGSGEDYATCARRCCTRCCAGAGAAAAAVGRLAGGRRPARRPGVRRRAARQRRGRHRRPGGRAGPGRPLRRRPGDPRGRARRADDGRRHGPGPLGADVGRGLLLRLLTNGARLGQRAGGHPAGGRHPARLGRGLSLLAAPPPVAQRRERAELWCRLGRHLEGAEQLEEYADALDEVDPAAADGLAREARAARAQLN